MDNRAPRLAIVGNLGSGRVALSTCIFLKGKVGSNNRKLIHRSRSPPICIFADLMSRMNPTTYFTKTPLSCRMDLSFQPFMFYFFGKILRDTNNNPKFYKYFSVHYVTGQLSKP